MLIASSINGFLFGLFSGQPLLILGPTGPFLVFEEVVYDVGVLEILKFSSQHKSIKNESVNIDIYVYYKVS